MESYYNYLNSTLREKIGILPATNVGTGLIDLIENQKGNNVSGSNSASGVAKESRKLHHQYEARMQKNGVDPAVMSRFMKMETRSSMKRRSNKPGSNDFKPAGNYSVISKLNTGEFNRVDTVGF